MSFEGEAGNAGALVLRDARAEQRATGLRIVQETVRFQSGGADIEGTLFRPPGSGPIPAVVLTPGAGLSSRYNLASEALAYAAAGVAAFVYDKPGLGRSGGNWLLLAIEDQVAYVTAAVGRPANRSDIGPVGVWGFSQGGWVAPLAAARESGVAFVVMVSGAAVSPQEQYTQAVAVRLRKALTKFAGDLLVAPPGEKFHYSSWGYVLALSRRLLNFRPAAAAGSDTTRPPWRRQRCSTDHVGQTRVGADRETP